MAADVELGGLNRARPARCLRDIPVPMQEIPLWADYFWPAGFREGVVLGLFTADDRYLGLLGLQTDTTAHPTDEARDLIGALGPTLAAALDPTRAVAAAARAVRGAHGGGEPPHFLRAAIVISDAGDRRGLTLTELEVLGMLLTEWPDERIAAALGASGSELAGHIERAEVKLATSTRGVALVRALNQGLYIPPGLAVPA
ncbi:helix-turn-helix transcriptional regulator [Pseudonocardia bannensis]|uniref:Helix-turn-helix transcriptional regulator n=1 Tax=Pseudonocardia bannensis TaxID=630973 RepID=A0A848DRX6_9PSEU|nr:helix-turn-helix transcriptional regulator [Pseudonocardia bannensis]NMH95592.1 helix-turn-helix transcriptional regulator [Pseudonocardia bannensis]